MTVDVTDDADETSVVPFVVTVSTVPFVIAGDGGDSRVLLSFDCSDGSNSEAREDSGCASGVGKPRDA